MSRTPSNVPEIVRRDFALHSRSLHTSDLARNRLVASIEAGPCGGGDSESARVSGRDEGVKSPRRRPSRAWLIGWLVGERIAL